ncbi:MAG: hypothetical protein LUE92_14870 [Clostridiales bacterium]|nr:hypothetical protein [Clostridiales bacterium]
MIIKRKYEWLGELYSRDGRSKALIDEAFAKESVPDSDKEKLLEWNHYHISRFLNLGCGIPGQVYGYFMNGFEQLDKEYPYDNGLTFNDVSDIEFETSRKGNAIQMRFVNKGMADFPYYRIVGFASVENKSGKQIIGNGWEMVRPYEIG